MTSRRQSISEDSLQETVVSLLRFKARRGVLWFSVPNGMPSSPRTAARFVRTGMKAGVADLCIVIDSFAYFLELKTKDGRQSPAQKAFELECSLGEVPYAIARSFDEAEVILTAWGAFRKRERVAA